MIQLLGFLLPPLIDTINQYITSPRLKFWISVGICTFFGIILDSLTNIHVTQNSMAQSILTVFGSAQISYQGIWESSKIRANIFGDQ